MARNNSKARKAWRKVRAESLNSHERLLMAIFGTPYSGADHVKPGTATETETE